MENKVLKTPMSENYLYTFLIFTDGLAVSKILDWSSFFSRHLKLTTHCLLDSNAATDKSYIIYSPILCCVVLLIYRFY